MSTSPYKPSPLSFGSPRQSPFRRPESPASPSPLRQSTPPAPSSTKQMTTPARLHSATPITEPSSWTPRGLAQREREPERAESPTTGKSDSPVFGAVLRTAERQDSNALSKLQPAQVRELREGFQILDRDSDGTVGREDVADMLTQLGMPATPSDIAAFFPAGAPQTVTLPSFLNQIATLLTTLSPSAELMSAFSAFDDDDSGQVDLAELRDALLHTAPEPGVKALTEREVDRVMSGFTARRAFGKSSVGGMGRRGEVFKYQEFIASVAGGLGVADKSQEGSEA